MVLNDYHMMQELLILSSRQNETQRAREREESRTVYILDRRQPSLKVNQSKKKSRNDATIGVDRYALT